MSLYLRDPDGAEVPVIAEWHARFFGELERRYVLYSKNGGVFYAEDQRGVGEDIAEHGVPVTKDEIFVAYKATMLQYGQSPNDNGDYVKEAPITEYFPGDTAPRDSFANELAVFERLRGHTRASTSWHMQIQGMCSRGRICGGFRLGAVQVYPPRSSR